MATARKKLSFIFLVVAVLIVTCCFVDMAFAIDEGHVTQTTTMYREPSTQSSPKATIEPTTGFTVLCKQQGSIVFNDPWWYNVIVIAGPNGWLPRHYVRCANDECHVQECDRK